MKTDLIESCIGTCEDQGSADYRGARRQLAALVEMNDELAAMVSRLAQADRLPPTRAYNFCEQESAKAQELLSRLALNG